MHDKAMRAFCALSLGLVFGGFAACAGTDVPPTDDLKDEIATAYANGAGVAGGTGGSANTAGSGGRASSAGSGGTADDDDDDGGAGGSGGGAGGSGAGSTAEDPDEEPTGGDCEGFQLIATKCGSGSNCHGAGSGIGNFAESEDDARSFIGAEGTVTCGGKGPLIDTDNPEQSVIVQKVDGTPPCGGQMPLGAAPLTEDEVACIVDWIGTL